MAMVWFSIFENMGLVFGILEAGYFVENWNRIILIVSVFVLDFSDIYLRF